MYEVRPSHAETFGYLCGSNELLHVDLPTHATHHRSNAQLIGIGDASGSWTHPASNNIVMAAGVRAATWGCNHNTPYVDADGEIHMRRIDPDAKPYHLEGKAAGRMLVSAMARNPHPNERIILRMGLKPPGVSDATLFTDMALDVFDKLPRVQGIAYDMAMHAENIDRIHDTGRHAILKVQRTSSGGYAQANLGEHIARFTDGRPEQKVVVVAIDSAPHIKVILDGQQHWIPLERIQTKPRSNTGTITLYGRWRIPDVPEVPIALRRGQINVRHNSTDDERASKRRRTRALRTIPETDPDFARLYGLREDAESMHHHLKSQLVNRRCRCVGDVRNLLYPAHVPAAHHLHRSHRLATTHRRRRHHRPRHLAPTAWPRRRLTPATRRPSGGSGAPGPRKRDWFKQTDIVSSELTS